MNLTKSQERILEKIKSRYNVKNIDWYEDTKGLYVSFDEYNGHFYNEINFIVKIGRRGKLTFHYVDRVCADLDSKKVLASLCCFELSCGKPSFSKMFM